MIESVNLKRKISPEEWTIEIGTTATGEEKGTTTTIGVASDETMTAVEDLAGVHLRAETEGTMTEAATEEIREKQETVSVHVRLLCLTYAALTNNLCDVP